MATFVLVHGAWHGGWCWRRVTPLLRGAGHDVHTPTLTGLGERAHLAGLAIDLDTHINDVTGLIEAEGLGDVVLVGHSYGGFVVSGVADRLRDRIRTLVFLDAYVPEDGKGLIDYVPLERRAAFEKMGEAKGTFDPMPLEPFGVSKPEDIDWAKPKLRPQPFATFVQPLKLAGGALELPRVFIRCTEPAFPNFEGFGQRARSDPRWTYAEVAGGHDTMITNPKGLADTLIHCA